MRVFILLLAALAVCPVVEGHRLDEYLQATRISVGRDRVELSLDLIPGVSIADQLLATVASSGQEKISRHDARVYAQRVIGDLRLEIDGRPQRLKLIRVTFPTRSVMREGEGTIQICATVHFQKLEPARHQIRFRNDHLPQISVYSANALVPKNKDIHITQQQRDSLQREYQLTFQVAEAAPDRK